MTSPGRKRSSLVLAGAFLGAAATVAGCGDPGPPLVPVEGRVVDRDGLSVYPGSIWLIPEAAPPGPAPSEGSSSVLGERGDFRLRTYPYGDGVPTGRYRATLSLGPGASPELLRYASPERSPLSVEVPPDGLHDLTLRLDGSARAGADLGRPPNTRPR